MDRDGSHVGKGFPSEEAPEEVRTRSCPKDVARDARESRNLRVPVVVFLVVVLDPRSDWCTEDGVSEAHDGYEGDVGRNQDTRPFSAEG